LLVSAATKAASIPPPNPAIVEPIPPRPPPNPETSPLAE